MPKNKSIEAKHILSGAVILPELKQKHVGRIFLARKVLLSVVEVVPSTVEVGDK